MAKVLTEASTVECGHKGPIQLATNAKLKVSGKAVVTKVGPQVDSAKCTNPVSSTTKQCTTATPSGGKASKLKVGGTPVFLDTVAGITDGNPAGTVTPAANQDKLTAS